MDCKEDLMSIPLQVLLIEDSESDADLIRYHLEKSSFTITSERVDTAEAMRSALEKQRWDIVISDYNLPNFGMPEALSLLQQNNPNIPFIIASGAISEETAIDLMRCGASDYLMKDQLARLGILVKRELHISRVRREREEAQKALVESELRFRTFFEQSPYGVLTLDIETTLPLQFNTAAHQQLGYTREEFSRLRITDYEVIEKIEEIKSHTQKILTNLKDEFVTLHRTKQGDIRTVQVYVALLELSGQKVFHSIYRDITEIKKIDDALNTSKERSSLIFNNSADAMFLIAVEPLGVFRYVSVNAAYLKNSDLPETDIIGKQPDEILPMQNGRFLLDKYRQAVHARHAIQYEESQGPAFVETTLTPILDSTGFCTHLLGTSRDISARKRIEESLRASEEKFSTAFRVSPDSININRLSDGLYIEINDGFKALTGYTSEEVIGKTSLEINIWDHPQDRARLVQGLREKGEVANLEAPFRIKNGTIKICLMSARIIEINAEQCILSIARDITELRMKERDYSTFIQTSFDGFWSCDTSGHFLDVNWALCQMLGFTRDELLGMCIADIEASENPQNVADHIQKIIQTGSDRFPTHLRRKDGTLIDAEISTQYIEAPNARFYVFIHDITERKRAEEALRDSEQSFREIFNSTSEAIFIDDAATGQMIDVNDTMLKIYGYECKEEVLAGSIGDLSANEPPYTDERAQELVRKAIQEGPQVFEWLAKRRDGSKFWVELSLCRTQIGGKGRVLAVARDITERKLAESKNNEQLEELRRWYAVTLGREGRIRELKEEVNELLMKAGLPARYASAMGDSND
jgi:PAS domain S-box-containing protein